MDINLTGTLATNLTGALTQQTDYLPIWTQIVTIVLTAIVTLGSVYLTQYLASESEARKHADEEQEKYNERRKISYKKFLNVFSEQTESLFTNPSDCENNFKKITGIYLDASLDAAEFGNIHLPSPIVDNSWYPILLEEEHDGERYERPLQTLGDFIETILNMRHWKMTTADQYRDHAEVIRSIGSLHFGPLLLDSLIDKSRK